MVGNAALAPVARLVARAGTELSASSPTGAALVGGIAYLAVRACEDHPSSGPSDGRDTPV